MLLVLPVIAFILIFLVVRRLQSARTIERGGWEATFVMASAFWGAGLALGFELLGLASSLRQPEVAGLWLVVALVAGLAFLVSRRREATRRMPTAPGRRWAPLDVAFVVLLSLALVLLLGVGWTSPPNNVDSLLYHMSRVVHWAQAGSLRHYATAYGHQLWNPPWAEIAILNLRILWGSDKPANLVQWGGLVASLAAVSGVARMLGIGNRGRMLAIALAVSLPSAVLQATSTQNDLVVSCWLVAALLLVILVGKGAQASQRLELLALGATFGLGLLTKGTFYPLLFPILLLFLWWRDWRNQTWRSLADTGLVWVSAIVVNLGHWGRNLAVSGTPLGPAQWIAGHTPVGDPASTLYSRVVVLPFLLLRATALHLATPWASVNQVIQDSVSALGGRNMPGMGPLVLAWGWNHEDLAGNPLHLLLIGLSLAAALFWWRRQSRSVMAVAAVAIAGYLLLVLLALPSSQPFGVRLQLPFFILSAPWVAAVIVSARARWLPGVLTFSLLLLSLPWLLFNTTRPVIAMAAEPGAWELPCTDTFGCTKAGSAFSTSTVDLLFANTREFQEGYTSAIEALAATTCTRVGLRIDSSHPEYPLWYLAQAPQSGIRFESIYPAEGLEGLVDRSFAPCAIICTICGERVRLHGLNLFRETAGVKLFAGDGFTWEEDG
ncbi:MAG: glycosyltransferase family 39 protein [Anaerolineales bacterium]|nr:glycosyltransferase family 39 protein [Anaerolineales bacterium]